MKSVLFFQYAATGEGWRTIIRYSNQSRFSDEEEVEKLKAELDPYYHVGIELHDAKTISTNPSMMRNLQLCVPELYDYFMIPDGSYKPVIHIKYEGYVNYS